MDVPLPSQGDTSWMDWAGEIHAEVDSAIDRFVSFVRVNTGDETRPVGAVFVLWVGGETQPTNMSGGDMWFSEGEPVPVAPSIVTSSLNTLNVGVAFSQTLVATGSVPITWAVTSGSLPAGITMNSSGSISGTPTTVAAYSFTVTATNSVGTDVQAYTGSVNAALTPPDITTTTLSAMTQGIAYSQALAATGDTPMTWTVTFGTMVPGLSLNTSTGVISGTPSVSGAYSFTVSATNAAGSDTQAYSGTIAAGLAPPTITTTSLSAVTVGSAYTRTLTATGSTPITWATTAGSLPAGLSLNSSTGVIDGTPTTAGSYSFTITATNSVGSDPQAFSGSVSTAAVGLFWFGLNTPDSANIFSDGGTGLIVGNNWYRTTAGGSMRVLGVRIWNPATADSTFLNLDLTVYAYARDWQGSGMHFPASVPTQTKTLTDTRVAGEWTNIYFDTPITLLPATIPASGLDCVTLAYRYGTTGYYTICSDAIVTAGGEFGAIESPNDDDVYLAEPTFYRANLTFNNGATATVPTGLFMRTWYGIDLIYEHVV